MIDHHRRTVLKLAVAGCLSVLTPTQLLSATRTRGQFDAIAFDAFPIFDPRKLGAVAAKLLPEAGAGLMAEWKARLFDYQWLSALANAYMDFETAAHASLTAALRATNTKLSSAEFDILLGTLTQLDTWPDAGAGLQRLQTAGYKLVFLSNMTKAMLEANTARNQIRHYFTDLISTDQARTYKPDPRAYELGMSTLGIERERILFVAFAGWDAAGARWFGYPTFWLNRANASAEALGDPPDGTGRDFAALLSFLGGQLL